MRGDRFDTFSRLHERIRMGFLKEIDITSTVRPLILLASFSMLGLAACASDPEPAAPSGGAANIVDGLMKTYDLNGDGKIMPEEAADVREQRFARLDLDGDGFLSQSEAKEMQTQAGRRGGMRAGRRGGDPFARLDGDGDGLISRSEFQNSDSQILSRADANGDGDVDRSELDALVERVRARCG